MKIRDIDTRVAELEQQAALMHHLQFNHYPPIGLRAVPVALAVIAACREDDIEREIDLAAFGGSLGDGRTHVAAWELREAWHLEGFCEADDDN